MKKGIIFMILVYLFGIFTVIGIQKFKEYKLDSSVMYQVTINLDYINVRKEINLSSTILTQVLKGEEYEVVDYFEGNKYNWYKVKYDKRLTGWVACDKDGTWLTVNEV